MSLPTQAKLLRVLNDGHFQRVGGNHSMFSDARVIAATNKDLRTSMKEGDFREDLFYRINVFQINIPPLRDRNDDVIMLSEHFFHFFNKQYQRKLAGFDKTVVDWLLGYEFPGNVRELKNIIERAVIMETNSKITLEQMPHRDVVQKDHPDMPQSKLADLEREHILAVMQQVDHNKSAAARILGIAAKHFGKNSPNIISRWYESYQFRVGIRTSCCTFFEYGSEDKKMCCCKCNKYNDKIFLILFPIVA